MSTPAQHRDADRAAIACRTWQCFFCGFVYDEAKGLPDEGLPPGTRWEDVPDDWACPQCGAMKADFAMLEI